MTDEPVLLLLLKSLTHTFFFFLREWNMESKFKTFFHKHDLECRFPLCLNEGKLTYSLVVWYVLDWLELDPLRAKIILLLRSSYRGCWRFPEKSSLLPQRMCMGGHTTVIKRLKFINAWKEWNGCSQHDLALWLWWGCRKGPPIC